MESHAHEYFPDSVLFWFDNAVTNIGDGELRLLSGPRFGPNLDSALAIQKWKLEYTPVYDGPSTYRDVYDTVGVFVFHAAPGHNHWHYEGFAQYRLLEVEGSSGVGPPVLVSPKAGFCLRDETEPHSPAACGCGPIEGDPSAQVFSGAGCFLSPPNMFQGISIGRFDLYQMGLAGQSMRVDGIPNGVYWLESTVDPNDSLLESSNSDNVKQIKVQVISTKDPYEPNNSRSSVDAMPLAPPGQGSANFAVCQFPILINGLSIHQEIKSSTFYEVFEPDEDWFRFRITAPAEASHYVRIEFDQQLGDLELELRNSAGLVLATSDFDVGNVEEISLEPYSAGWFYVRVFPDEKPSEREETQYHVQYSYSLEINAPAALCGDVSGDGIVNSADVVALSQYCNQSASLTCAALADVNGVCGLQCGPGGDLDSLTSYVFFGGAVNCNCQP